MIVNTSGLPAYILNVDVFVAAFLRLKIVSSDGVIWGVKAFIIAV